MIDHSKLVLHVLIRHLISVFPGLVITDVNPGFVDSPLYRNSSGPARTAVKRIGRTSEQGARNVSMAMLKLDKSTDVSAA